MCCVDNLSTVMSDLISSPEWKHVNVRHFRTPPWIVVDCSRKQMLCDLCLNDGQHPLAVRNEVNVKPTRIVMRWRLLKVKSILQILLDNCAWNRINMDLRFVTETLILVLSTVVTCFLKYVRQTCRARDQWRRTRRVKYPLRIPIRVDTAINFGLLAWGLLPNSKTFCGYVCFKGLWPFP